MMFDRTAVLVPRESNTYVNVDQQPNDAADAARLYGEVLDKAEARVAERINETVHSTGVEYVRYVTENDFANNHRLHFIAFNVNGKKFTIKLSASEYEDKRAHVELIAKAIMEDVMGWLLSDMRQIS